MKAFFGKYRGKVENNVDPERLGRLQVSCPAVLGQGRHSWAMPCAPYAGKQVGFFATPPKGANVWVEFEGGNIDYPIWSGGFWNKGEVPSKTAKADTKVFKTESIELILDDTRGKGGLTLKIGSPAVSVPTKLVADSKGTQLSVQNVHVKVTPKEITLVVPLGTVKLSQNSVEVKHGSASVKLQTAKVSLNKGALEVI